jgi:micrococcal nuclease
MKTEYIYNAKVIKVVDGDTVDMMVDLGFGTFVKERFRLAFINTPEINSAVESERLLAIEAKTYVSAYLNQDVTIKSHKKDKYGRYLAEIFVQDGVPESLNDRLVKSGLAKIYK